MITANETNRNDIGFGARVKLNPAFGTGTKYFVCYLCSVTSVVPNSLPPYGP